MKTKLSIAIITFNEEKNIARCIESVLPIAEEIFIVDSFSKDKTKSIALSYPNVRFIENPFEGHIQQKNFALQNAKNDWVLSLDADEALTKELLTSIQEVLENPTKDAYGFNRLTYYCGHWVKHCGWYPDTKTRLVRKDNAEWRGENPHDRLEVINGTNIGHLNGDLLHYSYYSAEQHYKQIEYFGNIASKAAYKNGKRTNWLMIILKTTSQFIKSFFIKTGFLDGYYGWLISKRSAYATYIKYTKLLQLQRNGN